MWGFVFRARHLGQEADHLPAKVKNEAVSVLPSMCVCVASCSVRQVLGLLTFTHLYIITKVKSV